MRRAAIAGVLLIGAAGCGGNDTPAVDGGARSTAAPRASEAPTTPADEPAIVTLRCTSGGEARLRFLSPDDGSELRSFSLPDSLPSDAPRSLAVAKGCGGDGDGRLVRGAFNDDFTLMAYSAQVEGESGAMRADASGRPLYHSGYVEIASGDVTDLTAAREDGGFSEEPASERFAYFIPGNRVLFMSDRSSSWEVQRVGSSETEIAAAAPGLDTSADADSLAPAVLIGRGGAIFGLGTAPLSEITTATAAVSPTQDRMIRNCYEGGSFGRANVDDRCLELVTSQEQADSTDRAGKRWTADAASCRPLDWYAKDRLLCVTSTRGRSALVVSEIVDDSDPRPWYGIGSVTPTTSREITAGLVSPDRSRVAFVAAEGANTSLYVDGMAAEGEPTSLGSIESDELLIGWTGDRVVSAP